jgi:hypothetical protein
LPERADAYSQNSNRDSRLKYLSHFKTEIGCGCGEQDSHNNTHKHRIEGDFSWVLSSWEEWGVFLSFVERPIGVVG